ncbi:hypothetical protein SAMN02745823_02672 [Sporobacter termitidis DSM 10068]|uniref:Spore coat protein n=1 Tax=Sporobacter termitidis DSM 10068 TaxID=1123282 RepID=A0A1M5YMD7_9FIRM|nr:spore coat protein [Sporobacter termitidis]SHI13255.1 hypothetical protein SAMN02745823_02672 [Sporobacter termitidis DSM 10068]
MVSLQGNNVYVLDYKRGDVTGDGVSESVYLVGRKPDGEAGLFAENITLVIEDSRSGTVKTVTPKYNAGYNPRLFLGDFNRDLTKDIKVSIDAGGSGGYGIFYVYSYKDAVIRELFDFEKYNETYIFSVDYDNFYRVRVGSAALDRLFILDISDKGYDYISQYYTAPGKLMKPIKGEVLAISALTPVAADERNNGFDLLAVQRIIGTTNADTLGHVENLLAWDGQKFASAALTVSIPGARLTPLY